MTILVTGATGNVGRIVVDRLLREDRPVRASSRAPAAAELPDGVDVVYGDLTDPESLAPALDGVDGVFLYPVPEGAGEFVSLARRAGVRRIVTLSSDSVTDGTDPGVHRAVEQAVEDSGLEWTHVRPGEFALNKVSTWAPSIRAEGVVRVAYPQSRGAPVHEADIADVAVAALVEDGHAGAVYGVSGPETLTQREQVRAIGTGIGRDLGFEEVSPAQARDDMLRIGFPPGIADYVLGFQEKWVTSPAPVYPTVERLTGRPARSLAEWAADHVPAFT